MERRFYLDLAHRGLAMPIGTDLLLHEHDDAAALVRDGGRLGDLMVEAANRYRTPLAFPVMNLELEKLHLLALLGVEAADPAAFQFREAPGAEAVHELARRLEGPLSEQMEALCGALRHVSQHSSAVPVGMCIGPFSLLTKLLRDPITPIALAGMGLCGSDDPSLAMLEQVLEMAVLTVKRYVRGQIAAGARAIFVCEPAANAVYLSPKQIEQGSDIFQRFVMRNLLRLKLLLLEHDVDLLLHDCGELTDAMVEEFVRLDPAILSLGSSRKLWEDAALLPRDIVLFGNLPSRRFYSDVEMPVAEVQRAGLELQARMREVGHPFILGSECDILSVPGCEAALHGKAMAIVECGATAAVAAPAVEEYPYAVAAGS